MSRWQQWSEKAMQVGHKLELESRDDTDPVSLLLLPGWMRKICNHSKGLLRADLNTALHFSCIFPEN